MPDGAVACEAMWFFLVFFSFIGIEEQLIHIRILCVNMMILKKMAHISSVRANSFHSTKNLHLQESSLSSEQ